MEETLVALLLAEPSVKALLGTRLNWGRAPQGGGNAAYAVLQRIDGDRDYTMQRASGYVRSRVQVDVYSTTYTTTKKAARVIIKATSGRKVGIFQGITIDAERDLPAADPGEVTNLFRTSIDLIIHHSE